MITKLKPVPSIVNQTGLKRSPAECLPSESVCRGAAFEELLHPELLWARHCVQGGENGLSRSAVLCALKPLRFLLNRQAFLFGAGRRAQVALTCAKQDQRR